MSACPEIAQPQTIFANSERVNKKRQKTYSQYPHKIVSVSSFLTGKFLFIGRKSALFF